MLQQNTPHYTYHGPTAPNAPPQPSANLVIYPATQQMYAPRTYDPQPWFPDSEASHYITADAQNLTQHTQYSGPNQAVMGNGQVFLFNPRVLPKLFHLLFLIFPYPCKICYMCLKLPKI